MSDEPIKVATCDSHCRTCVYYSRYYNNCDYILMAGHPRGCPAGRGCDRKLEKRGLRAMVMRKNSNPETRHEKKPKPTKKKQYTLPADKSIKSQKISTAEDAARYAAWESGMTTREIAQQRGVSMHSIEMWLHRRGLKPNKRKGKNHGTETNSDPNL